MAPGGATTLKVLDFGISKVMASAAHSDTTSRPTESGERFGTPVYMSPEQLRSAAEVDPRTDVWSLGVALFELLAGELPFTGESMAQLCTSILVSPPKSLAALRPEVSAGIVAVIARCLEKDVSRRYSNVGELALDLAAFGPVGSIRARDAARSRGSRRGGTGHALQAGPACRDAGEAHFPLVRESPASNAGRCLGDRGNRVRGRGPCAADLPVGRPPDAARSHDLARAAAALAPDRGSRASARRAVGDDGEPAAEGVVVCAIPRAGALTRLEPPCLLRPRRPRRLRRLRRPKVTPRTRLWTLAGALVLGSWLSPRPARADGSKAAAQALFDEGRALVLEKRFAEACPKLAESLRLDPGIGTHLWLADCYEKSGQTASAWAEFSEAAGTAAQQHDARTAVAQKRADALEARLTKLVIVVPPEAAIPGLEIRRDGLLVPATELRIAIPVDPGVHAVAASAPHRQPWSTTVRLPSDPGVVSLSVPLLEPDPVASITPPAPALAQDPRGSASDSRRETGRPRGHARRVTGVALGAAGVAGLAVGAFAGLHAKSLYDDSTSSHHCLPDNECDGAGKLERSSAFGWATASTVAVGAGAAAVAAGAIVFFTAPNASTTVRVSTARGGAEVVVGRSF